MTFEFDPRREPGAWPGVLDGRASIAREALVPVHGEGFLLGRAVFTTARWRGGRAEFFDAHVERLRGHALAAGLADAASDLPDAERLRADLDLLAPALGNHDVALRWTLFPSDAGVSRWLGVRPLPTAPDAGIALVRAAAPFERHPGEALKHTGRLSKLLERERARERGAHDAFGVARDGEVLGGTAGCLVWAAGERAFTPPARGGLLDSVTRGALLAAGAVAERRLDAADLDVPSELLWVNSLHGVLPVHTLEGRTRALPGAVGPVFARLSTLLEGLARAS